MSDQPGPPLNRRDLLRGVAGGGAVALAGCSWFDRGDDGETSEVEGERAQNLAEEFAPALYFDTNEKWFPTDPRQFESEREGETIVDGFDAFEGYVNAGGSEDPPEPSVFYHVVEYEESSLAVVQFWLYSAFDQFSTNFHWHDWELLQVFVDTDSGEPQLHVASAHSRSAPNNEHLDPDPAQQPRLLSELGSHSSGLSINDDETQFQRLPLDGGIADITNSVVDGLEDIAAIPLAYGLPRDEGLALPYLVPELDGEPIYDHPDLPSVEQSDLVSEELVIDSFDGLRSPPANLPMRETGLSFEYEGRDSDADESYQLVSTAELEHIEEFAGEQLSFPFAVPQFAEDIVADHITTTGVPWKDTRYESPASDITETNHRQALANRYDAIAPPSQANQVIARVTNVVSSEDAPEGDGLASVESPLEMFALLQSEPRAVPTFQGLAVLQNVPEGEHRLTINGAGVAPHSETVTVTSDDGPDLAGAGGEIPVVANENATKLEVDPRESDADLRRFAVEDDFAGRLYEAPLSGPDAVYVHRGGAFTAEVKDADDEFGAVRVNPDPEEGEGVRIDRPETGKASLATYLADVSEETRAQVAAVADEEDLGDSDDDDDSSGRGAGGQGGPENAVRGLAQALEAIVEAAERAAERARANDRGNTDQQLEAVATRLERAESRLAAAEESLPPGVANAASNRLGQSRRRSEQARNADKL